MAANATTKLGNSAGIKLSGADGGFALLSNGLAGRLDGVDTGNVGVDVSGLNGLDLNSTTGMTFRMNTTGTAVSKTVTAPGRSIQITFPDGKAVKQIDGAADFRVSGASGRWPGSVVSSWRPNPGTNSISPPAN